jgi:hypothetical protein
MNVRAVPKSIECIQNGNRWTNRETSGGINHASVRPQGHDPCATALRPFADGRPPPQGHGTADVDPIAYPDPPSPEHSADHMLPLYLYPLANKSQISRNVLTSHRPRDMVKLCPLNHILSSQADRCQHFRHPHAAHARAVRAASHRQSTAPCRLQPALDLDSLSEMKLER